WGLGCVLLALAALLGGVGVRAAAADTIIIIIPGKQTTEPVKDKTAEAKKAVPVVPSDGYFRAILFSDQGTVLKKQIEVPVEPKYIRAQTSWLANVLLDKDAKKQPQGDQEKLKKAIQELEEILKSRPDSKDLRELIDRLKAWKGLSAKERLLNLYDKGVLPKDAVYKAETLLQPAQNVKPVERDVLIQWLQGTPQKGQIDMKKLEKLLEQIQKAPDKIDPKELNQVLEEIRKAANVPAVPYHLDNLKGNWYYSVLATSPGVKGRFGIRLSPPSNDLREYLGLPKGQGLLIEEVDVGSPAAKAGLKVRDIVLKLNGQAVPSDTNKAGKMFVDVKDGADVNLTILRRGKEEVIKGLKPVAPDVPQIRRYRERQGVIFDVDKGPEKGALVTILSEADKFTATHRDQQRTITIKGTLKDGKVANLDILIKDGKTEIKTADVNAVPEAWRPRVQRLLQLIRLQANPQSSAPDHRFRDPLPQGPKAP
ncbi:MAG TPA: PDZ domain-containing protein, partial [Gemmataceae bacterium]|nr:PDZ domain-containing protein [Gemmataceae bacterium]